MKKRLEQNGLTKLYSSFENLISIEASLLELKNKAKLFQESTGFFCRTMTDQAQSFAKLTKEDYSVGPAALAYANTVHYNLEEAAYGKLRETLELKVFEPMSRVI